VQLTLRLTGNEVFPLFCHAGCQAFFANVIAVRVKVPPLNLAGHFTVSIADNVFFLSTLTI